MSGDEEFEFEIPKDDPMDEDQVKRNVKLFNVKQKEFYDLMMNTILHQNNMCNRPCTCPSKFNEPIRMLLSGVAGSGTKVDLIVLCKIL